MKKATNSTTKTTTASAPAALDEATLAAIVSRVVAALQTAATPAPAPAPGPASAAPTPAKKKNQILKSYARDSNPKTGRKYARSYIDLVAISRDYVVPSSVQLAFAAVRALGLTIGGFSVDEDGMPVFVKRERAPEFPAWLQEAIDIAEAHLRDIADCKVEAIPQV